jgi:hypothetical protein
VSRPSQVIALMVLLAAFVWVAQVVAGNLGGLPVLSVLISSGSGGQNGSSGVPASLIPPPSQLPGLPAQGQAEILSAVVLLGVMLGYLTWRVRKNLPRDEGSTAGFLIFVLIALGAFFALLLSGKEIAAFIVTVLQSRSGGNGPGEAISSIALLVAAGVVAVTISSLAMIVVRRTGRRWVPAESEGDALSKEFGQKIRETLYSLRSGSDFRSAVLGCYKALCDVLQSGGASNPPELTAREFEAMAREKLSIRSDSLSKLTGLFERARYSRETIGESDAREAEASLLSLEREIRSRPGAGGGTHP